MEAPEEFPNNEYVIVGVCIYSRLRIWNHTYCVDESSIWFDLKMMISKVKLTKMDFDITNFTCKFLM